MSLVGFSRKQTESEICMQDGHWGVTNQGATRMREEGTELSRVELHSSYYTGFSSPCGELRSWGGSAEGSQ